MIAKFYTTKSRKTGISRVLVNIEGKIKKSERRRIMEFIIELITLFAALIDLCSKTMKNNHPTYQQIYIPVNVIIVIR